MTKKNKKANISRGIYFSLFCFTKALFTCLSSLLLIRKLWFNVKQQQGHILFKNYNSNPDLQALDPMPFQYITKERTSQEEEYMSGTGKMHRSKSVTRGRETI